jgi:putative inorganic carbon (HCO3(-)) transporter
MWQGGWDMFLARPILGHGLGTFMHNFINYRPQGYEEIVYAHNCFLQMAAEIGVIGLATFLWMIIVLFDTSIRSLRKIEDKSRPFTIQTVDFAKGRDKFYRAILLGLLGGLLAYLAHSAVDTNLYSLPLAVLFWFILGLVVSLSRLK